MSFPQYENMKNSGVEWLGDMPSHWRILPLLGVAIERDEPNIGMKENNLLSLSYGQVVRKDINANDGLLPETFETYQIVRPGDIVWRLTDLQNDKRSLRTALVTEVGIITSAYLATKPRSILPNFFGYLLRAYDITKVFYSMGGGLRQSMKFDDVKRLPIIVPPAVEQSAIAAFLERETRKIDALVEEQQRLVHLLEEKRQATVSHAVTRGLNTRATMKETGVECLLTIPEHWIIDKLAKLTTAVGDGLHGTPRYVDQSDYHFINGNNLVDGSISIDDHTRCVDQEVARAQAVPLNSQTILMSINGTIGNLALYMGEPVMLGKSAAYLNCTNNIDREFLYYFLQSAAAKTHFELELTGTTISNLSLATLRNAPIPVPPLDEQRTIAKWLQNALLQLHEMIGEAEKSISLLKERRSALISAAITGKIDIRGLAADHIPISEVVAA
jgi:type I restriction enzyme, S subunit